MTLTVGSLFSGIGGIDLALERAGMVVRWQVEVDPWCRRVLAKHWPDVPRYGDIREVDFEAVERVDVLAGGHPCQPDSNAGKRRGTEDERWLWPEFERAIRLVRPQYVLVENPTGILRRGGGMPIVLGSLAALGYDAEWTVLSAAEFGAPHIRERVFIVAHAHSEPRVERRQQSTKGIHQAAADHHGFDGSGRVAPGGEASLFGRGRECRSDFWLAPPRVADGVDDGLPYRVAGRLYGNSVVPQCAEYVGRLIVELDRQRSAALAGRRERPNRRRSRANGNSPTS